MKSVWIINVMVNLGLAILSYLYRKYWISLFIYRDSVLGWKPVHLSAHSLWSPWAGWGKLSIQWREWTLQQPINMPIYQEDHSGSVGVDINKASHQPSNYRDHSNHDPPTYSTDPSNSMDTCSKKSCDNFAVKQETLTVDSRLLKILTFNIWNTNVVQGGYKQYISRIKQIAKVSEFIYSSRECINVILYF